jgi:hypothetical protein
MPSEEIVNRQLLAIEITFYFPVPIVDMDNLSNSIGQMAAIQSVQRRSLNEGMSVQIVDVTLASPGTTADRKMKIGMIVALIKQQLIRGDKDKVVSIWSLGAGSGDLTEVRT